MSNNMRQLQFFASNHIYDTIMKVAKDNDMRFSRVLCQLVDNAIEAGIPFTYDLTLPDVSELEHVYADEGGIFLKFMKSVRTGIGLDILVSIRNEIGIPDKDVLLIVFAESLQNGLIEEFTPIAKEGYPAYPEGYKHYRIPGLKKVTARKVKNKTNRYEQYLKLKKEFGSEA